MKYIILLGDGMADYPLKELDGKTPLEAAHKPNIESLARSGVGGLLRTIPDGMGAGSDVANLSILGYDPKVYYTGRGPLEAASIGVELGPGEMAFRCNLITERDGKIHDYSAGHISSIDSRELIKALNDRFRKGRFYPGVSYRNLFVTAAAGEVHSTPPHDVIGGSIRDHLLKPTSEPRIKALNEMIMDSRQVLSDHPINKKRLDEGKHPANMIWLWGEGVAPSLESFKEKFGLTGAVISAVDLIKGIGIYSGLEVIDVPGATGLMDTNWRGKAEAALHALERVDMVYLHVEAIDEAAHAGDVDLKIQALEAFDKRLVGPLLDGLDFDCTIGLLPDHYTPISLRTHTSDPVPYVISAPNTEADGLKNYSEREITKTGSLGIRDGHMFMNLLLK